MQAVLLTTGEEAGLTDHSKCFFAGGVTRDADIPLRKFEDAPCGRFGEESQRAGLPGPQIRTVRPSLDTSCPLFSCRASTAPTASQQWIMGPTELLTRAAGRSLPSPSTSSSVSSDARADPIRRNLVGTVSVPWLPSPPGGGWS